MGIVYNLLFTYISREKPLFALPLLTQQDLKTAKSLPIASDKGCIAQPLLSEAER